MKIFKQNFVFENILIIKLHFALDQKLTSQNQKGFFQDHFHKFFKKCWQKSRFKTLIQG